MPRATSSGRTTTRTKGATKPTFTPPAPHADGEPLKPVVVGNYIWAPLRKDWLVLRPEEIVRQAYILRLVARYGYDLSQMDQERRTKHGRRSPKADIVVWPTPAAKADGLSPIIVIECKSDNVTIVADDYDQGDSYA